MSFLRAAIVLVTSNCLLPALAVAADSTSPSPAAPRESRATARADCLYVVGMFVGLEIGGTIAVVAEGTAFAAAGMAVGLSIAFAPFALAAAMLASPLLEAKIFHLLGGPAPAPGLNRFRFSRSAAAPPRAPATAGPNDGFHH